MSSTSHALGPNEPPAPPNWVMGQPYRRRSGLVGSPGSVCPAHALSGRTPGLDAARPGAGRRHGRFRPRIARPRRELPAGHAAPARAEHGGLRPPGLPRVPGAPASPIWAGTSRTCWPWPRRCGRSTRRRRPRGRRRPQLRRRRRGRGGAGLAPGLRRHRRLRAPHALAGLSPPAGRAEARPRAGRPCPRTRPWRWSTSSPAWSAPRPGPG